MKAYAAIDCPLLVLVLTHFYVYYEGKKRPEFKKKSNANFLIESGSVESM